MRKFSTFSRLFRLLPDAPVVLLGPKVTPARLPDVN
jgi:hypothetical protein